MKGGELAPVLFSQEAGAARKGAEGSHRIACWVLWGSHSGPPLQGWTSEVPGVLLQAQEPLIEMPLPLGTSDTGWVRGQGQTQRHGARFAPRPSPT